MPGGNKRSYVQVCLSTYELLLTPGIKGLNDLTLEYIKEIFYNSTLQTHTLLDLWVN